MFIDKSVIDKSVDNYNGMLAYHQYIESLFETLDDRFEYGENEKRLLPISKKKLFANSNDYSLYSQSEYPCDIWLPPWHGRFYVDMNCLEKRCVSNIRLLDVDNCPVDQVEYLVFVWTWLGCNDAHVADTEGPECWIGFIDPQPTDPKTRLYDVSDMVWKFIRIETTTEQESEGWIKGRFYPNRFGSQLNGSWEIKRFPLKELSSMYEIQTLVVSPLTEKLNQLSRELEGRENCQNCSVLMTGS